MANIVGVIGILCVVWGLIGVYRFPTADSFQDRQAQQRQAGRAPEPAAVPLNARSLTPPAMTAAPSPAAIAVTEAAYYPLEVGRYWVYRYEDETNQTTVEIVRAINGREHREGKDLFYFEDGTVAYADEGKVFEMGVEGGVNVIPMDTDRAQVPFVYTSEGMRIHKQVGARDTSVVVGGHRFDGCMEIITKFKSIDQDQRTAISYSSFYAPGIGLVGREGWPERDMSLVLTKHGSRPVPSTPVSKAL